MAAPSPLVLVIALLSLVIGICLLVTAALTLDDYREGWYYVYDRCYALYYENPYAPFNNFDYESTRAICNSIRFWLAASSIGVIAGAIQILSFGVGWLRELRIWFGLHILICILCAASFGIAMDQKVFGQGLFFPDYPDKIKAFAVIALVDMLFSVPAAIGMLFLDKNRHLSLH